MQPLLFIVNVFNVANLESILSVIIGFLGALVQIAFIVVKIVLYYKGKLKESEVKNDDL